MDHYEMVEKLRAKANVSYEEAKAALEASEWDILDALVLLESEGKVKGAEEHKEYTTQEKVTANRTTAHTNETAAQSFSKVWEWIKCMFRKGNANQFVIRRGGEEMLSMPITVMVLLLVCFWPFSLILLFVGLFLGCRYSFRGPDVAQKVNDVMTSAQEKAAKAVEVHLDDSGKNNEGNQQE